MNVPGSRCLVAAFSCANPVDLQKNASAASGFFMIDSKSTIRSVNETAARLRKHKRIAIIKQKPKRGVSS